MLMRTFKTKVFARWAAREGLTDRSLRVAIQEMERGLVGIRLGSQVYKKRVALPGRGKRGSTRTLIAYRRKEKAFFALGFAKNERANIDRDDLRALRLLARELLGYSDTALKKAIQAGEVIEVREDG